MSPGQPFRTLASAIHGLGSLEGACALGIVPPLATDAGRSALDSPLAYGPVGAVSAEPRGLDVEFADRPAEGVEGAGKDGH